MVKIISLLLLILVIAGGYFVLGNSKSSDQDIENFATKNEQEATVIQDKKEVVIIAFGDSLTAGYGLPENESYPSQLEAKLKADDKSVKVVNAGVNGETTRGNLERAEFIRDRNPDIVILGTGGNDILRQLPFTETKINIDRTIEILKQGERPPKIILLKMQAPLNSGLQYKLDFDSIYEDMADKYDLVLVPFITLEVFSDQDNKLSDGIHFNQQGYEAIIDLYLYEAVKQLVEEAQDEQ